MNRPTRVLPQTLVVNNVGLSLKKAVSLAAGLQPLTVSPKAQVRSSRALKHR
jgi:hypothetical protein